MKLYLNSNILKGTPEELVTYQELLKDRGLTKGESEKSLFSFGHIHESTEQEAEEEEVDNSVYDKGAFYTVTEEAGDSLLPVGTILHHQHGRIFNDSQENICIISSPSFVYRGSIYELDDSIKQGRFELAKQLGIKLTSTTDFAVEASDRTFKFKEDDGVFAKGESVKIVRDDNDRLPLVQSVKDSYKEDFAYIGKLELVQATFKGFFGSLKIDKSSIESTESSTDEEQTPSTELKVGDRVKVLNSLGGAEGEATVTAVLEGGMVELAGNNKEGSYLSNWSNYISNVEKIEKPASFEVIQAKSYLEGKSIEQVVEDLLLYEFYEVVDPEYFASSIKKGTILKRTSNTYTQFDDNYIKLTTSTGLEQKSRLKDNIIKPVTDDYFTKDRFEFAKQTGVMLTVDTDFAVECIGHQFRVTDKECLSNFEEYDILTIRSDDGSNVISFRGAYGDVQFTLLEDVREIARPNHYK